LNAKTGGGRSPFPLKTEKSLLHRVCCVDAEWVCAAIDPRLDERIRGTFVRAVAAYRSGCRPASCSDAGTGHVCPGSVPGNGFVHRDHSLVLPFGIVVSARAPSSSSRVEPSCRLLRAAVLRRLHAAMRRCRFPARVEDRLRDGDNVVNTDCATMHNRSQKS
jgi:hypothetical protein